MLPKGTAQRVVERHDQLINQTLGEFGILRGDLLDAIRKIHRPPFALLPVVDRDVDVRVRVGDEVGREVSLGDPRDAAELLNCPHWLS